MKVGFVVYTTRSRSVRYVSVQLPSAQSPVDRSNSGKSHAKLCRSIGAPLPRLLPAVASMQKCCVISTKLCFEFIGLCLRLVRQRGTVDRTPAKRLNTHGRLYK